MMWKTGDDKFDDDLVTLLKQYPGIKMSVGPVLTAFDGQPYTSQGVVVWVWPHSDPSLAKMFHEGDIVSDIASYLATFKNNNVI